MKDDGIKWIGVLIVLMIIASFLFTILNPLEDMYRVTFINKGKEVTIETDLDGIIRKTSPRESEWKDRAIIGIRELKSGSIMTMYDLYGDVKTPEKYEVKEVTHEPGIL